MGVILFLCLAFAALAHPTPLGAEAWLTATLAVLALATLGAVYGRRPFWGGVAIVGGGFLVVTLVPGLSPRLVTHRLVEWHYRTLSYAPMMEGETVWVLEGRDFSEGEAQQQIEKELWTVFFKNPMGKVTGMPATSLRPLGPEEYQWLWHSILAFPVAFVGGLLARLFSVRGNANELPA